MKQKFERSNEEKDRGRPFFSLFFVFFPTRKLWSSNDDEGPGPAVLGVVYVCYLKVYRVLAWLGCGMWEMSGAEWGRGQPEGQDSQGFHRMRDLNAFVVPAYDESGTAHWNRHAVCWFLKNQSSQKRCVCGRVGISITNTFEGQTSSAHKALSLWACRSAIFSSRVRVKKYAIIQILYKWYS